LTPFLSIFRPSLPDERGRQHAYGAKFEDDRAFALASASLRQAMQEMPDITEISKHIMIEETQAGPQHRDRRPGRPLDVSGRGRRSRMSAPAA